MSNPHYTKPARSQDPDKQRRLDGQYGGPHRTCPVCGETKPAVEFAALRYVQDGLNRRRECRRCVIRKDNNEAWKKKRAAERQRLAEPTMPPHLNPMNQLICLQWQP